MSRDNIVDCVNMGSGEGKVMEAYMKLFRQVQQGSLEWLRLRAGVVTCSELDNIISPGEWKPRTGDRVHLYMCRKLSEWFLGQPLMSGGSWDMEQGKILEEQAVPSAALDLGVPLERVGFCLNDAGDFGCSPDGFNEKERIGVEVKCLQPPHHVACLLRGELPKEFSAQVYGSMLVTGFREWVFYAYSRQFPPVLIRVPASNPVLGSINDALGSFMDRFEEAKQQMIQINGGPPERKSAISEQEAWDTAKLATQPD